MTTKPAQMEHQAEGKNTPNVPQNKQCRICGEHHASVCKFCQHCREFHHACIKCKQRKKAQTLEATMQRMPSQQRRAAEEHTTTGRTHDAEGEHVNDYSDATAAAVAEATITREHGSRLAGLDEATNDDLEGEGVQEEQAELPGKAEEAGMQDPHDEVSEEAEAKDHPDEWRERIDLRAVELCDQGVELSTPPFPFHQGWDPQYPRKEKRKKRKRSQRASGPQKQSRASPDYKLGSFTWGSGEPVPFPGRHGKNIRAWTG